MRKSTSHHFRILAIAPSSRGFGFAVLEEQKKLVDWGVKSIRRNKNAGTVEEVDKMIGLYRPCAVILEHTPNKRSRRSIRIRLVHEGIENMVKSQHIPVILISREKVRKVFFTHGLGSKEDLVGILAERFPEELSARRPPKRRPWMSEDYRMGIFDAVSLGTAYQEPKACA